MSKKLDYGRAKNFHFLKSVIFSGRLYIQIDGPRVHEILASSAHPGLSSEEWFMEKTNFS